MDRPSKVLLLILLVPFVAMAAWLAYHETRIPQNEREVLNRMIELQRQWRYDKAVQVVQNWMRDSRRDASHDEFLYGQIAMVFIMKAYERRAARNETIRQAELNLEKALNLYDAQDKNDLSLEPFQIGQGYEVLADISGNDKCRLYKKAQELLEQQLPLIKGDSYTAYGHTTPLEAVRKDVTKHLNAVNEKSSKAGCQTHLER